MHVLWIRGTKFLTVRERSNRCGNGQGWNEPYGVGLKLKLSV